MNNLVVAAASRVTDAHGSVSHWGARYSRLDPASRLVLLAVEALGPDFDGVPRNRIGICLVARAGSLSTDVEYWNGRQVVGGLSPTLFAYTLPSAAIGEIAIRHRLTGPNLCLVGDQNLVLSEAADMIRRGEADGCVCVYCHVVTPAAAAMIQSAPATRVCALFLRGGTGGLQVLGENDRDMESLCDRLHCQTIAGPKSHERLRPRTEN